MTRENVLDMIYSAKTLSECQQAWKVRDNYLCANPDDVEVIDAGESLSLVEELLFEQSEIRELTHTS